MCRCSKCKLRPASAGQTQGPPPQSARAIRESFLFSLVLLQFNRFSAMTHRRRADRLAAKKPKPTRLNDNVPGSGTTIKWPETSSVHVQVETSFGLGIDVMVMGADPCQKFDGKPSLFQNVS